MTDSKKELARVFNISDAELQAQWDAAKANKARLDCCEGPHEFAPVRESTSGLRVSECCSKCGGTADALHVHWYKQGIKHSVLLLQQLLPLMTHAAKPHPNEIEAVVGCTKCLIEVALLRRKRSEGSKP